ncbi:MAG TPA: carboxypeptidase regulatory-like domain-containing protein [Blastocatellia bacterium]|nr:carboxypeptidase regulatory-like domain-containing protein [Blastocatellia bacterium]HMV84075.1 carboxypeptidase regulatory-like domain-containing protein [Blastocatellia bacterium]HMX24953.1 carboxypeptidase regulatory-like domain-containing protein [Blastocatellia bacterium]HMY72002.1 carboxypeptidase regulatory-like domain-containing protein [Blastocatellia bacterium]HMZ16861.1 carboxypeptidase regulatory-like domain-containing protein [Blastocatellia bacterium]
MVLRRMLAIFLLAVTALTGIACGKKEEATTPASSAATWKPSGNEGNITGVIAFNGATPAPRKLDTSNDSACGETLADDVLVKDGKLQNVLVHVKSGLPQTTFEVPASEVELDQRGCKYSPRVLGIQAGQMLKVVNSDATTHNVHPVPKVNREWNESQAKGQGPIIKKFSKPETQIPVKCNLHSWMTAHISVLSHPFYSVSAADGTFTIKGLPPGEYEIEAWHEKFGAKTMKVTVAAKADAKADFSFDAATAYNAGSLKVQPALILP